MFFMWTHGELLLINRSLEKLQAVLDSRFLRKPLRVNVTRTSRREKPRMWHGNDDAKVYGIDRLSAFYYVVSLPRLSHHPRHIPLRKCELHIIVLSRNYMCSSILVLDYAGEVRLGIIDTLLVNSQWSCIQLSFDISEECGLSHHSIWCAPIYHLYSPLFSASSASHHSNRRIRS